MHGESQVGSHFEIYSWELMCAHTRAFECAHVYLWRLHVSGVEGNIIVIQASGCEYTWCDQSLILFIAMIPCPLSYMLWPCLYWCTLII